jgi:quinol-cytochrome oxidoreductase complex cytochrome b subunit
MAENKLINWKRHLFYTTKRDDRSHLTLVANNLILHLHPINVPAKALRFTYTWGLGGISAILTVLLALTGLLLMFRYDARIDYAYISIQQLESTVAFGSLVRGIHHWSANLLVITTFLHLLRVFFTGSFKQGRTANWLIGMALLLLVLGANFTGYLLPWDQLAYWAITVSTSLLTYLPLIGNSLRNLLLGGPAVGQGALSNFYAIHVVVIPMLMISISLYHFWKVRKNGGISQPLAEPGERAERKTTIPHLIEREVAVALVVITAVFVWAMVRPSPLGELANPFDSPNPAKAAWYFLGLQELMLHMQPLAVLTLVFLVLAGLALVPFWDRDPGDIGIYFRSPAGRWSALLGALLGFGLVPLVVILDEIRFNPTTWLPGWPTAITAGLLPLLASLTTLVLVYFGLRRLVHPKGQSATRSEALLGVFTFLVASLVMLTIIGIFFRGPNMALVMPF